MGPEPTVLGEILGFSLRNLLWNTSYFVLGQIMGREKKVKRKQSISWTLAQVFFKHLLWDLFFTFPCAQTELLCPTAQQTVLRACSTGMPGGAPAAGAGRGRGTTAALQPARVSQGS